MARTLALAYFASGADRQIWRLDQAPPDARVAAAARFSLRRMTVKAIMEQARTAAKTTQSTHTTRFLAASAMGNPKPVTQAVTIPTE